LSPSLPKPIDVLGLPVHPVTMNQAVLLVERFVSSGDSASRGQPFVHVALNGPKWVAARDNSDLAASVTSADLVTADGVGILAMSRRLGHRLPERVTGIDLMDRLCARAAAEGWPVALLGGREGVGSAASTALRRRYRDLRIVYCGHGYFAPKSAPDVAAAIAASGARLLFVGMNTPRKEDFVAQHGVAAGVDFAMGVGGAFDVLGGRIRRAPRVLQELGLEWAWRWAQEPKRLAPRYGWDGARFALATLRKGPPQHTPSGASGLAGRQQRAS
jgi:N-acetylglucosaminyldiphosphoundecaprenol N-acetyl-beta-D-mannosaminyltransferase